MLDKGTFGNSKASIVLMEILNKRSDKKLTASVTKLLSIFFTGIKEIDKIKNEKIQTMLRYEWTKKYLKLGEQYDREVRNFLSNVISTENKKRERLRIQLKRDLL
jgi:hypothetical protein